MAEVQVQAQAQGDASLGSRILVPDGVSEAKAYARGMLKRLTLEEKVLLLTGADSWRTNAIPRLGISKMKTSDGPVGVRGGLFADGVKDASLPTGVALAATWDHSVIRKVSQVLVAEAKSKVDVLLGPTGWLQVCLPTTPLGGRNFKAYSEDPFLTGKLAATYINTIQAAGIGACIKHFAANDQETRQFFIDEYIPDRALREIHLQPSQIAIRDSNPWTLMTAYNKINGTFCSAHAQLLQAILRGEWGWDGTVMSDWFGTNTIVPSVKAGTGKSAIPDWKEGTERAEDLPEHREVLRHCGAEAMVLLKNKEALLPLKDLSDKSVAFIGPNAIRSVATGGGSSNLEPHYRTTPVESFRIEAAKLHPGVKVVAAPEILAHRYLPLIDPSVMKNPETGTSGFTISFWNNTSHEGETLLTESRPSSYLICYDGLPPELTTGERYSYRAKTIVTPKTSGIHQFSLSSCGPGKLLINGQTLIDIQRRWWSPKSSLFMSYGSPEERDEFYMEAGISYELVLESISRETKPYQITYTGELEREEVQDGGRIGFLEQPPDDQTLLHEATELAQASDFVVIVVGRDADWETETSDMETLQLPRDSDTLIAAVVATNPNTVVVNQTSSPITMPWINEVPAIVQAWYLGQEQGNCLADVLLGNLNPCEKLPITFPRRIEDNPSYDKFPGGNDRVQYGEGIFAGYRYYDHRKIEPLFPFGAGLSYTAYEYSNIRLSSSVLACGDDEGPNELMSWSMSLISGIRRERRSYNST
ncbi:hypothetical protein AYO20_07210 [Fonsecaea nubica]|uniref:beta-glucosidase n=1 Tax=Fonsecaea nubica TaxID=856822 RepID=A0A178CW99_9EURO|nr:hypothetical protein AYO20_07210 [Fonsecaea nubica]OAL33524.1 hypothetical protein AYO20_07210 [Fonsecaea nubica]